MKKAAIAVLTHRYMGNPPVDKYSYTHGAASTPIAMRTIEVKTKAGKPISVFQAEDTPLAIEKILKENGWSIVAWNGDLLQLRVLPINNGTPEHKTPTPETSKNVRTGVGCVAFIVSFLILFASCSAILNSNDSGPPSEGSEYRATLECQDAIKTLLNAPSTAKFSNERYRQLDNEFRVVGFVESENRLGGIVGASYRCNVSYDPSTGEYTVTSNDILD